jgi:hypothetical protein
MSIVRLPSSSIDVMEGKSGFGLRYGHSPTVILVEHMEADAALGLPAIIADERFAENFKASALTVSGTRPAPDSARYAKLAWGRAIDGKLGHQILRAVIAR